VRHVAADGRAYLRLGTGRYDIIEADALRPNGSHAGNLYSLECFEQWRRQLTPGGFAVSWLPSRRVADTFVKAFPHVICFDQVLIGSEQPISYDPGVVRARAARARAYYARAGVDIDALLGPYLDPGPWRAGPERDRSLLADVNTDLFPKDEYAVPWTK